MSRAPKAAPLSITALYTSQVWAWGKLPDAHLFENPDGRRVFAVTNAALGAARLFRRDFIELAPSLLHRHAMMDALVRQGRARQVVELAAGLSRRGATFSADPQWRYTEIDLPEVVAAKRALLERSEEGRAVLARPNFRLVPADVETAALESWVEPGAPTLVLAEGLFMYLTPAAQATLWRKVAGLARTAAPVTLVFDLVPWCEQPKPGAVGRALERAMKAFTQGRSFERDLRTRQDVAREVAEAGFAQVQTFEPKDVMEAWALPYPHARTQQLIFQASTA